MVLAESSARPDLHVQLAPELYPNPELVRHHMKAVTLAAAISSAEIISQFTPVPDGQKLSDRDKKIRVGVLDSMAASRYEDYLARMVPFIVLSVGSEGEKELEKIGEAMPTVLGEHGSGIQKISIVNDVVEGTTAAAHGRPGAISVLAASTYGGLMPTPQGVNYMEKFFGPPQVAGKINIDAEVEENLEIVRDVFGVEKGRIHVVTMNRKTNQRIIDGTRNFGADLVTLEAGDLVPSLLAMTGPTNAQEDVYLVMGRGGFEEGIIAAAAGRALGSHVEAKIWRASKDDKDLPQQGERVLTIDDLVPGFKEHSFVTFTPITEDKWFGIPGVRINGDIQANTVLLSSEGLTINQVAEASPYSN